LVAIGWANAHSIAIKWLDDHLVISSKQLITKNYHGQLMATESILSILWRQN
jgi:hypothetical protein